IAKPALEPTCRISSTGSSEMMPYATAPEDARTPKRLNAPDHTTARLAGRERGEMTGASAVAGAWEAVAKLTPSTIKRGTKRRIEGTRHSERRVDAANYRQSMCSV